MIKKFWNNKNYFGLIISFLIMISSSFNRVYDLINTFLWRLNLRKVGKNTLIQKCVSIRYPGGIVLGNNVNIGRYVAISTEIKDACLSIGNNTQVNKNVLIDFSGNVEIGENVVISSDVKIFSHSHGYFPKSKPIGKKLIIRNNVWIGSNCLILENVGYIGEGSIIAAGSIVTKRVDKETIVGGNPARVIKHL